MAAGEDFLSLIGEQGLKDLETAKKSTKELAEIVIDTNGKIADMYGKLKNNKSFSEFNKFYTDAKKLIAELQSEMSKYSKATFDQARAEESLNKARSRSTEATKAEKDSITGIRQEIKNLTKERNGLSLATEENRKRVSALNTEIDKLNAKLRENGTEQEKQRANIGNYKSHWDGLGRSVQQVARELPSLTVSANQFFLAISNNLPMLNDEMRLARERNEALRASGEKAVPVWKQMAGSIISWQTALVVAITLLSSYGTQIKDALFGTKELDKATKKYNDSLNSISESARANVAEEIAHIRVLESLATSTDKTVKAKEAQARAVDELQKLYPQTLKDYDDEAIKAGKAKDAINELTQALISKSLAQAAEKKFAAASEKVYDLMIAQAEAEKKLAQGQEEMAKANAIRNKEDRGLAQYFAQSRITEAKSLKAAIAAELQAAEGEQKQFLTDSMRYAKEAGQAFINETKDPKAGGGKSAKGSTLNLQKELNDALADLQKQRYERDARLQESAFKAEKTSLESRLAAHAQYTNDLLEISEIEQDKEEANLKESYKKHIADAKGNKKLLLEAEELYQQQLQAIREKYSTKNQDIVQDEVDSVQKTMQDEADKIAAIARAAAKDRDDEDKEAEKVAEKKRKERIEKTKKTLDTIKEYETDTYNFVRTLSRQQVEQRIADLETLISKIDSEKKVEIDAIKQSGNTAEKKIQLIAEAEAKADARKQVLEQRQADAKRRQASFEKNLAVAKIFVDMFIGIAKEVADKGVAGLATGAAIGAYISGIIGALGAVAIPQYAEGTDDHPGGLAIAAEAGQPEFYKEPGKDWKLLTKPTLDNFAKHTQFVPMDQMIASATAGDSMSQQLIYQMAGIGALQSTFKEGISDLKHAIKNKQETSFVLKDGEWRKTITKQGGTTTYLNSNLA